METVVINRPSWNIYIKDFDNLCIKEFNIFDHDNFWDDCQIAFAVSQDYYPDYSERNEGFNCFSTIILYELNYWFKQDNKWNIKVTSTYVPFEEENFASKIVNVCSQIELNKEQFLKYLWNWFMYGGNEQWEI